MSNRKTINVVVWPDGSEFVIKRRDGAYWWSHKDGSSHMDSVKEQVAELGGRVERRPNPAYREPSLQSRLNKAFGG